MPDFLLLAAFLIAAALSLGASALLVDRLERVGAWLVLSEAILGLVAALAADSPEITTSALALVRHQHDVAVGVIFGSNNFNLASMLGVSALVAGRIRLHRRVVIFAGSVAILLALIGVAVALGSDPTVGLAAAALILVPYVAVSAAPSRFAGWLRQAVMEEQQELRSMVSRPRGRPVDLALGMVALTVVVGASSAMEFSGAELGLRYHLGQAVVGGLLLAVVTSLPNAVVAIYLAAHRRGSAVLSSALNSNTINVLAGLLVSGSLIGLGHLTAAGASAAWWNLGLTAAALAIAYLGGGLGRAAGLSLIVAYVVYVYWLLL